MIFMQMYSTFKPLMSRWNSSPLSASQIYLKMMHILLADTGIHEGKLPRTKTYRLYDIKEVLEHMIMHLTKRAFASLQRRSKHPSQTFVNIQVVILSNEQNWNIYVLKFNSIGCSLSRNRQNEIILKSRKCCESNSLTA